jgi:CO dehydrogenase maturation factor
LKLHFITVLSVPAIARIWCQHEATQGIAAEIQRRPEEVVRRAVVAVCGRCQVIGVVVLIFLPCAVYNLSLGMKIAVSGKGGVGKTMLASLLSTVLAQSGCSVLAIDADPNATLATALGFAHPERITPISEMADLIEERTGARPGQAASYFRLNPKVDDIPEKYWVQHNGVKLMVMGRLKKGGSGCYCPENALLEALLAHILLRRNEVVIIDMEAGVEHLGRATARAVDKMIIVVEPGKGSIDTAFRIRELAKDIDLKNIAVVANKVRNEQDGAFIMSAMPDFEFLGFIPYDQSIIEAGLGNFRLSDSSPEVISRVQDIAARLSAAKREPVSNQ